LTDRRHPAPSGWTPARCAALHKRAFTHPRPWTTAEFAALQATPGVFLVTHAKGFALGRVVADEAKLLTLAVSPEARRQGVGSRLVRGFEAQALAEGAATAFLEVAADNRAARALYRHLGYRESGRRKGYYRTAAGQPVDAVLMTRPLGRTGEI